MFKHDRAKARKENKCLACGQPGHFRPECPIVSPENRVVKPEGGSDGTPSPKASSPAGKGGSKGKVKPKAAAQAKGVTEEVGRKPDLGSENPGVASASAGSGSGVSQEALLAEAAKLLKGVSLKPLRVEEGMIDTSWLRSALVSASDPSFCLVDSGATNALRPAAEHEL